MLAGGGYGILAVAVAVAVVLMLPSATRAQIADCDMGDATGYAANSTFGSNLNLLVASLAANASASPSGYAATSAGAAPDQVYALALCRGDVNASSCAACVAAALVDGKQSCGNNKSVTMYEDDCVLRYSGLRFMDAISSDQWQPSQIIWRLDRAPWSEKVQSVGWFNAAVTKILSALANYTGDMAGNLTSKKYFATGEMNDFNPKIYGFAQCVPDMTPQQCKECVRTLGDYTEQTYKGNSLRWVSTYSVWCRVMYSVRPFYGGRTMLQISAPPPPAPAGDTPVGTTPEAGAGKKKSAAGIAAGVACSVVVLLVLSVLSFVRFKRRTKAVETDHPLKKITRAQCMIFDLPALQEATENFSENNKLGEGGFGTVYKGVLSDGQEVAVKKLLGTTGHGLDQLHNEVLLLAELQHKNLVRLQGFCLHQEQTLLVYEYIKNGSLDNILFDISRENALKWDQQYNIILGIAKGILYLHEDSSVRIIHRDLKSNNILLGEDMEPKIADFGLAKLLGEGHTHTRTTRVVGTFGYMAPEYVSDGNVSTKIDIFSFGVLVLEIVTRRRNDSGDHDLVNLLSDVWNCWTKGTISKLIDQSLDGYSQSQALRCIQIGLLCVQSDPDDRPHISSVIFMLTRENMELQPPAQPAFFFGTESVSSSSSHGQRSYVYDRYGFANISVNDVTLTEPYPR
uniref:Uncharacterized protein n=1 Tax=Leersia perrieri TaxID=77586 RepID=A0A0D9WZW1_9ORYZ